MAGFVGKFASDCDISKDYGYKINRARNLQWTAKNFSHDSIEALLSSPEELREDIVSSDKLIRKTFSQCNAKNLPHRVKNFSCNVW